MHETLFFLSFCSLAGRSVAISGSTQQKKEKKNLHTLMVEEKSGHTSAKTFNNLLFDTGGWEIDDLSFIKV